jgi:hypothetical protein
MNEIPKINPCIFVLWSVMMNEIAKNLVPQLHEVEQERVRMRHTV